MTLDWFDGVDLEIALKINSMLAQISRLGSCLADGHFRASGTAEDAVGSALGEV